MPDKNAKKETLTYEVGSGLYINLTNKCTNACDFCIRNNGDGAYGSDSLWLDHEPSEAELKYAISLRDIAKYSEVVFCGYGEPSMRLDLCESIAREIREKHPSVKIRINTNGQSDLYYNVDTAPRFAVFDAVSVSLNAPDAKRYDEICHSRYGERALPTVIAFAKRVKAYTDVCFSVVDMPLTEGELSECKRIADGCGIPLRVREYISD